jgi:hypothetical protein
MSKQVQFIRTTSITGLGIIGVGAILSVDDTTAANLVSAGNAIYLNTVSSGYGYSSIPYYVTELGSDGVAIPINSLEHTYADDTNGNLATDTVVYLGNTYVRTFTWADSQLISTSVWQKQ